MSLSSKIAELVRKTQVTVEETWHERSPRATTPLRHRFAATAVVRNPFAGRYEQTSCGSDRTAANSARSCRQG